MSLFGCSKKHHCGPDLTLGSSSFSKRRKMKATNFNVSVFGSFKALRR